MTPQNDFEPRWASVRVRASVYIENADRVLLVNDPVYRGGCWTLPGGGVEFEEKLVEAAEREVLEETGITVKVHSLWRVREIWERENDYPTSLPAVRRSLEFILVGDYICGEIDIHKNPSHKPDRIPRVKECRWVPLEELGSTIDGMPIYPVELFGENRPAQVLSKPLDQLMLPALDLRGDS